MIVKPLPVVDASTLGLALWALFHNDAMLGHDERIVAEAMIVAREGDTLTVVLANGKRLRIAIEEETADAAT